MEAAGEEAEIIQDDSWTVITAYFREKARTAPPAAARARANRDVRRVWCGSSWTHSTSSSRTPCRRRAAARLRMRRGHGSSGRCMAHGHVHERAVGGGCGAQVVSESPAIELYPEPEALAGEAARVRKKWSIQFGQLRLSTPQASTRTLRPAVCNRLAAG